MVRATGTAPVCSCSRSRRLTFRLRSDKLPSALNPAFGHYFDRARSLPAHQVQLGKRKWSSIRVLRPVFRFGRPACISQHLCSEKWSPVREFHPPERFCRPSPELLGQRDIKMENAECEMRSAKCGMLRSNAHGLTAVCSAENNSVDDDGPYGRESVPATLPTILATVARTFSG